MHSSLGRMKNVAQSSNPGEIKNAPQQWNETDLELLETIRNVTKESYQKNQQAVQAAAKTCKQLFKKKDSPANPKVLLSFSEIVLGTLRETRAKRLELHEQGASPEALEKKLRENKEHYNNYIQYFLPALLREVSQSKELKLDKIKEIAGIISGIIKQSLREEEYEHYFLSTLEEEITKSKKLNEKEKKERNTVIMELKISDDLNKIVNESHPSEKIAEQSTSVAEESGTTVIPELNNGNGSDSGVSSFRLSEDSSKLLMDSRRSSVNSILSSAEEDDNPQIEETKSQVQPGQTVEQVKENENSDGRADGDIKDQVKEKPQPGTLMTDGHRNPLRSEEKDRENATVQEPSVNKNNRSSNKQPSPVENMSVNEFFEILEEIKKGDKNYSDKKAADIGAPGKCKRAFKKGVDPEELLTELEKSVKGNTEHRNNFTNSFLPVLLKKTLFSVELEGIEGIAKIIWDFTKRGLKEEEHERYGEYLLQELKTEIKKTKRLVGETERNTKITIAEKILGNISKNSNKSYPSEETAEQPINVAEESDTTVVPELSDGSDPGSKTDSDEQPTPGTSSEESLDSTPRSVEGNSSLRKEETEDQMQSEQTAKKEPEVSFQHVTLESREKESRIPVSSTGMTDGHSNPWQSEKKKDSATTVQNTPANKNNSKGMPQSNNRDLYKGFATGCAGLAVGCLIAGVITLGAGLFVMAAVFAIAAIATRYLTPPSSELTSTTLSPLVDAKQR